MWEEEPLTHPHVAWELRAARQSLPNKAGLCLLTGHAGWQSAVGLPAVKDLVDLYSCGS